MWTTFNSINDSFNKESEELEISKEEISDDIIVNKVLKISTDICYNCSSKSLIVDDGMNRCTKCGYTNGLILDMNQEWRYYGSEDSKKGGDPTRCGMPSSSLFKNNAFGAVLQGYGNGRYKLYHIREDVGNIK